MKVCCVEESGLGATDPCFIASGIVGHAHRNVSAENLGYDVESRNPDTGQLRFIEVKGRAKGAPFITLTRNEILTALNKPESWWLAIVLIEGGKPEKPVYLKYPFREGIPISAPALNFTIENLMGSQVQSPIESL